MEGGLSPPDLSNACYQVYPLSINGYVFFAMTDGDDESMYFAHDERNVKQVVIWHGTFGMKAFSDEEFEKLMEYAKFLISLRE